MPKFEGAIFDVDGVLVDSPHEKAWRESLRELMEGPLARHPRPDDLVARRVHAAGVPEADVRASRAWTARARRSTTSTCRTTRRNRGSRSTPSDKQAMVVRLIEAGDFTAYPDALRFVLDTKDAGIRIAAASSSKNANLFLGKIRLDRFAERAGARFEVRAAGPDAAGRLRRRRLGPGRSRTASPTPTCSSQPRTNSVSRRSAPWYSRTRPPASQAAKAGGMAASASPGPTTPTSSREPGRTSWSPASTRLIARHCATAGSRRRRPRPPDSPPVHRGAETRTQRTTRAVPLCRAPYPPAVLCTFPCKWCRSPAPSITEVQTVAAYGRVLWHDAP